ncbi:MAG: DNA polymerase III subunit gamma/tau [Bacteroidales bacterium]|nr:DNA polymerase III subunit gamma/tau [Bacteroidales bacterium]
MENFVVSARKYRPATFDMVVGQISITNTLKNAIRNNQLAQAFLFCGPRGVGKTTCARILAKTINCERPTENIEPCNECTSCTTFNESSSFNIHELDAASNNSVDDIRNLVDQVRIPPQMGRYKVYIIDEVHMLSSAAFNAFLKTLEEPPAYAKFILATTEKHKIIPTILSRCQIFDFKRITIQDIASHLSYVAQKENVAADPEALHIIAQKADGALRDALSVFDQMVNLGNRTISRELVLENLNVLDHDYYFRMVDHMLRGNIQGTLLILNEIIEKGFDGQNFITGLGEHLRNVLMCVDASTSRLLDSSDSVKEKFVQQAKSSPLLFLIDALEICNKCDVNYRTSNHKRLTLEVALIQICQAGKPVPFEAKDLPPVPPAVSEVKPEVKTVESAPSAATPVSVVPPPAVAESVQSAAMPVTAVPAAPVSEPEVQPSTVTVETVPEKSEPLPVVSKPEPVAETKSIANPEPQSSSAETLDKFPAASVHSIRDILSQGANVAPKQESKGPAEARKELFDHDKLLTAINKYAEKIQDHSSMLFTALTAHQPQFKAPFGIRLTLDNAILQKEVNDAWIELMAFLKEELQNDLIEMETEINTQPIDTKRFLSDKDKLDAMKLKNPNIAALSDQLNLELDVS